jgi:hypothetical protein
MSQPTKTVPAIDTAAKPAADFGPKIAALEAAVAKLKDKKKDSWDKFQILASLLIPASIALVGYLVANATKEAEVESASRIAVVQTASAETIANGQQQVQHCEPHSQRDA